jgi:hypothetical protein
MLFKRPVMGRCAIPFAFALLATAASFALPVVNGSFEDGLNGWTLDVKLGHSLGGPVLRTRSFEERIIDVTQGNRAYADTTAQGGSVDGSIAARVQSAEISEFSLFSADGEFVEGFMGTYTVFLYQDIYLNAGDMLAGAARFMTGENNPIYADFGRVSVGDTSVWDFTLKDLPSESSLILDPQGPWETWRFAAPSKGVYRLKLEVYQDDEITSWAYFDDIRVFNVADGGATGGLLLFGLGGLAFARHRISSRGANHGKIIRIE